ncbi:MAG: hydrogenase formation protein HypD [Elusimicrobia bacterium]|nr:hydrogenase formation protein HypD [Elusimicrobiota bacterium]MBD3411579.1 hydrogenase formation protein HypD [Elusimicrobiota bacterium]
MISRPVHIMEVCGTHTMAIARSGIKKILPPQIKLISGPGCPVCVTDQSAIDQAIKLARQPNVIMTTFGDMMRVPGSTGSLSDARTAGADIRTLYSPMDAVEIAQQHKEKNIVFMGVGFETTSPTIAATVMHARTKRLNNFFVLTHFKLLFPALAALANSADMHIDGFICPGHVSVITGTKPYEIFARKYKKPCVITGFEDSDIINGITRLMRLIRTHAPRVEIEYTRAVRPNGNTRARNILYSVFKPVDSFWRGFGSIPKSGLAFKKAYKQFDAESRFSLSLPASKPPKGCLCGDILRGVRVPSECRHFGKRCTPEHPIGPCMVSSEGTCAAEFRYGTYHYE